MKFINVFVLSFVFLTTGYTGFSQTPAVQQQADTSRTVIIKVKGITCAMDLKTIAANVEQLAGISSCKAEKPGATTKFEVKFNPALVTEKEIYAAIEGTGGCKSPDDRPYKVKQ